MCIFQGDVIYDFENDKVSCSQLGKGDELKWDSSGALRRITTIKDMYAEGWKYEEYYNMLSTRSVLMSKGGKTGGANAVEVAVCRFTVQGDFVADFTNNLFECTGALKGKIVIKDMDKGWKNIEKIYLEGWKYKGSYDRNNLTFVIIADNLFP